MHSEVYLTNRNQTGNFLLVTQILYRVNHLLEHGPEKGKVADTISLSLSLLISRERCMSFYFVVPDNLLPILSKTTKISLKFTQNEAVLYDRGAYFVSTRL